MQVIRRSINLLVISVLATTFAVSQDQRTVSIRSNDTSFDIGQGSSFSASGSSNVRATIPTRATAITSDLREAFEIVSENHASFTGKKTEDVFASSINKALQQLDPHSSYFTRKQFQELNDDNLGRYFGTGMSITDFSQNGDTATYIVSIEKNSPAEVSGFKFGDKLISVNGVKVEGKLSDAVRDMIRGPEGTLVTISVEHPEGSVFKKAVRRSRLPQRSIEDAFMIDDSIGYIAMRDGFTYTTVSEFNSAYDRLKRSGMRSVIVDLRQNGGGLLEQSVKIAEKFLPEGRKIVSQRGRYASEGTEWRSRNSRPEILPIVVLVDENTASAAEIFAAAMQDNDRGLIIGTRTFGKGLVQDIIPLSGGAGLTLTSERYYAPSGRSIQREYSDGHLYDYFRHLNSGSLIDQPTFAAKTLGGRTVYGGDGIAPDISVESKKWTAKDLREYEAAFFEARKIAATNATLTNSGAPQVRSFLAVADGNKTLAARILQETDRQLNTAINTLRSTPLQN